MHLRLIGFHRLNGERIAQTFANIPPEASSLDLSGNFLGIKNVSELITILAVIPKNIISLDLAGNFLGIINDDDLARIFTALPSHVTNLSLSHNNLFRIPRNVNKKEKGKISKLFAGKINTLKNSLPHVKTISLGEEDITALTKKNYNKLGTVFPNIETVYLVNFFGTGLKIDTPSNPSCCGQVTFFAEKNKNRYPIIKRDLSSESICNKVELSAYP